MTQSHRHLTHPTGDAVAHPPDAGTDPPAAVGALRALTTVGAMQFAVLVVTLLRSKVLAVLLEPEGVGVVSTLDQLVQFVALVSALSIITTPTRFIARAVAEGVDAVTALYSVLLKVLVLSTGVGTALAIGLLLLEPRALGPVFQDYRSLAVIAVLTAPLVALSGFFANVAAATRSYSTTSVYLLATAVLGLMAALIGIRTGGVAGLYYGNMIAGVLAIGALAYHLHATIPLSIRGKAGLRDEIRRRTDILAYCGTVYVLSFTQPLAFLVVRSVMLQRLGAAEVGYFQAAFTLSSITGAILVQGVRVYLEPKVNLGGSAADRMALANEFQRMLFALVLVGTLPLVLFSHDLVAALFTAAFTPASAVVFVLVLTECLFLCSHVYATVLMALDDFTGYLRSHLAGHAAICVAVWFLADPYGLAGVAWSLLASRALVLALVFWLIVRRHRLVIAVRTAGVMVYTIVVLVAAALIFGTGPAGGPGTAARLIAWLGASLGTLAFLTGRERQWLGGAWRRFVAVS